MEEVKKITDGKGAHAALVTAASSTGYTEAVDYLRSGGKLMAVGLPAKATLDASIFFTVFKVRSIANLLCAIILTLHIAEHQNHRLIRRQPSGCHRSS